MTYLERLIRQIRRRYPDDVPLHLLEEACRRYQVYYHRRIEPVLNYFMDRGAGLMHEGKNFVVRWAPQRSAELILVIVCANLVRLERWQSGLMYRTRNAAYRKVPWVRIPPSPPRC